MEFVRCERGMVLLDPLRTKWMGRIKQQQQKKKKKEKKKNISPSLALVQPRKTIPFITERLLMGPKESNQQINSFATRADPDQAALVRAA